MQSQQHKDYESLLAQFIAYRQSSFAENQALKKEVQKCRQMLEKMNSKIDKRVDTRLKEESLINKHRLDEMESQHRVEIQKLNRLALQKDKIIEDLRNLLRSSQIQKKDLVHSHTKILIQLNQQLEIQPRKQGSLLNNNYKELLKMYDFLLEENNQLKKEIHQIRRDQIINPTNLSYLEKQEKCLVSSHYSKQRQETNNSQDFKTSTNKSFQKDKTKQKGKKPPLQKSNRK